MARGSGWSGAYNRTAKDRRGRYARAINAIARAKTLRGNVGSSGRYRESYGLPF